MAIIITKEQKNLLRQSDITRQFPFIQRVVLEDIKIDDKKLHQFTPAEQEEIKIIKDVVNKAEDEWEGEDYPRYVEESKVTCSLCGNSENKYIFYINNKSNGNEMNVGSSCIEKFRGLNKNKQYTPKQLIKEAKQIRRIQILNSHFGDIRETIRNWNRPFEELPIVVSNKVEGRYLEIGKEINNMLNDYIKHKMKESDWVLFDDKLKEAKQELIKINDYVEIYKYDKFSIPKAVEVWLNKNQRNTTLRLLKEKGFFTKNNVHNIFEPNFMQFVSDEFNSLYKEASSVVNESTLSYGFTLMCDPCRDVKLFIGHNNFISICGDIIFRESDTFNLLDMINECHIIDSTSKEFLLMESKKYLRQVDAYIYEFNVDNDEVVIRRGMENIYVKIGLNSLLDKIKIDVYAKRLRNKEQLQSFIFDKRKVLTRKEVEEYKREYQYEQRKRG